MNAFAARGVQAGLGRVKKPRFDKRPQILIAALAGSFVAFGTFVTHFYHREESVVWIWMGIRSDDRCGRDYGTDYIKETTCGKGSCCSSHGWCGISEEYCSVALGCQNGCWAVDEEEQKKIDAKKLEDDESDRDRDYDDDSGRAKHYRYDDDSGYTHHNRYRGYHHDDDEYHDYNHRYDEDPDHHNHGEDDHHHDDYHHSADDIHDDDSHGHDEDGHGEGGEKHDGHYDGHYDEGEHGDGEHHGHDDYHYDDHTDDHSDH